MDRLLYVSMTGARETLRAQALVSQNLANANTTGFRQDVADFRSMPVFGDQGLPTRAYAMAERSGTDLRLGHVMTTGRELDVAVQGEGWIAVQGADGKEAYTRAGDLQVNANGLLTTMEGQPVLGNGGPISIPPAEKIEIGASGAISIRPIGEGSTNLAEIDRIKLVKPAAGALYKDESGLMRPRDGQPLAPDAAVRVLGGALESSNVNAAEALVNMIESSRRFEVQIKMMKVAEDNSSATNQLLRLE
ncbi:MAG TPA: flagellar basal-body rod protein FlgF [Candidatus Competibacter sp.]|nr:flagellar basal-body rod protein FlgF [Candidatus Competibacteraceae bacterium]HAO31666.1 flagellar basal-body rod protein FlgF [Candidatus Competibacteraceae bacterium]HRE55848.1 flagellar basal-body rod protein FlgF [Candidatus Competibacter sp.]HUM95967.1 flagellar basal-body rod protein FlgF [Candidatus Competibacter sp.]